MSPEEARRRPEESVPYTVVADRVLEDPEVSAWLDEAEEQADRDAAAERVTVSFRWGRSQLAVVKRAAALAGVPYQTYLKVVVFRQAAEDLRRAADLAGTPR